MSETGLRVPRWFFAVVLASLLACFWPHSGVVARDRDAQAAAGRPQVPQLAQLSATASKHGRKGDRTQIVELETAPFPYDGTVPTTGKPFFDVFYDGRFGRRGARGQVYWENETYSDQRVLLHIPDGFDIRKPGIIVVFFHGHGARIDRDVRDRQQVPAQISKSSANAVLVAPQFALDAADSSPGAFWEPGVFPEFLSEAAEQLALLNGTPRMTRTFFKLPVIIIGYSGGYLPTAFALSLGNMKDRLRGIVLLDALYGELDKFEDWIANSKSGFFVSAYLNSTRAKNIELRQILTERKIESETSLETDLKPGSVVFISGGPDERHSDYVTQAWAADPITDILNRLPEFKR